MMSSDDYLDEVERIVAKHGWMAQGVFAAAGQRGLPWIYTVGWSAHVEMAVTGALSLDQMEGIMHSARDVTIDGPGDYDGVLRGDYKVRVREVAPHNPEYPFSIAAAWRQRHAPTGPAWNFVALQILWPDVAGKFPDEEGYDQENCAQPLIEGTGNAI